MSRKTIEGAERTSFVIQSAQSHLLKTNAQEEIVERSIFQPLDIVLVFLPLATFALWLFSLQAINLGNMNELGLVSVFPPPLMIALGLMSISFCLSLRRSSLWAPLLLLHVLLFIFMLYGVNAMVEQEPRFSIVYRHAGYTEYIMRTGTANPSLDAYFSWPGFFTLSAFLTKIAGYPSILGYAAWAPVVYNVLYFGPLYILFEAFTHNKRLVWLAVWLFFLTNWIGQDYFSPQGLNFFLYLVLMALLVRWFRGVPVIPVRPPRLLLRLWWRLLRMRLLFDVIEWATASEAPSPPMPARQRKMLIASIIVIFAFSVFSHQLTPFFVLMSACVLVIFRRCSLWWMPLLMAVMLVAWLVVMTRTYLAGHMGQAFGGFLDISAIFSANVSSRVAGDPLHTFIARLRIIMTVLIWFLALIAGFLRWRKGYHDATIVLLALAPFPLLIAQPYGGEMLLRIYLFSQPPMVFLVASLFFLVPAPSLAITLPTPDLSHWKTAAIAGLCLFLLAGFLFTRYGNEDMDYMTVNEVTGVQALYAIAKPGSFFLGAWTGAPWQYKDYEMYTLATLSDTKQLNNDLEQQNMVAIVQYMLSQERASGNAYLLFTRTEIATYEAASGDPPGIMNAFEQGVRASGYFKLVYSNPDVQIFELVNAEGGT